MVNGQLFGGDWTEEKLAILARYLKAYNTALSNQPFTRVYVDAFAGTGYRQQVSQCAGGPDIFQDSNDAESTGFLKGSAKLALEVDPAFHRYLFIESEPAKVAELKHLKQEYPDKADKVDILQGDANAHVRQYCQSMQPAERAVVFLDPFATQVSWDTVATIAGTKAIDVWILFPLMAVNRLLANDPTKAWKPALDRIFGTTDWFDRFYHARVSPDLFGQSLEVIQKACDFAGISAFYKERLQTIFAGVAPTPRTLYNSRETPLFQLFFAAGNPKGATIAVKIAKHLLEKL